MADQDPIVPNPEGNGEAQAASALDKLSVAQAAELLRFGREVLDADLAEEGAR